MHQYYQLTCRSAIEDENYGEDFGYYSVLSVSHTPLDLYLSTVFMNRSDYQEFADRWVTRSTFHSPLTHRLYQKQSKHPLICFSPPLNMIYLGNTDQRFPKIPGIVEHYLPKISKGNHIAFGLSDGTVRFIGQNCATMIEPAPTPETAVQPNSEHVVMLPSVGSKVSADFAGSVSNLVLPPITGLVPGDEI